MAAVAVKKTHDTFRVHPRNFERLCHAFFAHVRLDIEVVNRFGKVERPKEWFEVPVQTIDDFVKKFREHGDGIANYRYNPDTARIERIRWRLRTFLWRGSRHPRLQDAATDDGLTSHILQLPLCHFVGFAL